MKPCGIKVSLKSANSLRQKQGRRKLHIEDHQISGLKNRKTDRSVGYCRPPIGTRFQKGQSGNPKGRPKGRKNIGTIFNEILHKKVEVREGNRVRTLSKIAAAIEVHMSKALKGDARAFAKLMDVAQKLGSSEFSAEKQEITEIRRIIIDPKGESSIP
jgi:hypothetical protein